MPPGENLAGVTVVRISSGPLRGVSLRVAERRLVARLRPLRRRRRTAPVVEPLRPAA
jgi:hypothetical protein